MQIRRDIKKLNEDFGIVFKPGELEIVLPLHNTRIRSKRTPMRLPSPKQ